MRPHNSHSVHDEFCAANSEGAFFPNTFLLFLDFPEEGFWGNRAAYRTLWHEYMHFLQSTTTTYGVNMFMRELELAELTIKCVRDIRKVTSNFVFPLTKWRRDATDRPVRELLDSYCRYRDIIEQDLATLQGACRFDSESRQVIYKGKPVFNQAGCPFQDYYEDPTQPIPVPLGSRAIMEGAASALEFLYLSFVASMEPKDSRAQALAEEWANTKESDPSYYATIDMTAHQLKDEEEGGFAKLLALSDLALCPPVEFTPLSCEDDAQRYPGRRLLAATAVAKNMPSINPLEFHDRYKTFVGDICSTLGWPAPWEMASDSLTKFVTENFLFTKGHPFCDLIGPALVLLNGLSLRKKYPMYCANPIPNMAEAERVSNKRKAAGKGAAIIHMEMIYAAHTPPFVKLQDGSRTLAGLAKKAMAGQIAMDEDELIEQVSASFERYFYIQRLCETIWSGRNIRNGAISCLLYDTTRSGTCQGSFARAGSVRHSNCVCTDMFHDLLGFLPNEATWVSAESSDQT